MIIGKEEGSVQLVSKTQLWRKAADVPYVAPYADYFTRTPWPSTTVRIRSIPGTTISSFFPLGQSISTLSTFVAVLNQK